MAGENSLLEVTASKFSDQFVLEAQQKKTRLEKYCKVVMIDKANRFAYDAFGDIEATEISTLNDDTTFDTLPKERRWMETKRWRVNLPVDPKEEIETIADPKSSYMEAAVSSLNRQKDRTIARAMFADIKTGRDLTGATTVTYANDGGATIDIQAGFTYAKLQEITSKFIDNEVGNDMDEEFFLMITGLEHSELMADEKLINADYISRKVVDGRVMEFAAGYEIVKFGNRTLAANTAGKFVPDAGATPGTDPINLAAGVKGAMCLGLARDVTVRISERPDKNYTRQVFVEMQIGAVRTEGKKIIKLTADTLA